ncbi:Hypothetical protein R9X50_00684600 [Acrodontium crateriforme]|uniref:Uncharacterized protein n=1 Tax=Acrodontium crateriforme TaxID=150365 RepID=A0AAQ3MAU6_9PEZI|nr:Hypothetical protein R9X50_00684600 [Acrodontium crateriforme]
MHPLEQLDVEVPADRSAAHETKRMWQNYLVIAILNTPLFFLTIYGCSRLRYVGNLEYSSWDALKLCLSVSILNWLFMAYGLVRHYQPGYLHLLISYTKKWDRVIAYFVISLLNLIAAIVQTSFITQLFYCKILCGELNQHSKQRNIGYTILTWFLFVAWLPRLIRSSFDSRTTPD